MPLRNLRFRSFSPADAAAHPLCGFISAPARHLCLLFPIDQLKG
jgi:hypothetical protein